MSLSVSFERVALRLEHPFTIARGTTTESATVVVTVEDDDGRQGYGGASPSARFGETIETVESILPRLREVIEDVDEPETLVAIEADLKGVARGNAAARAGLSIALHDLIAKRHDLALHRWWGLPTDAVNTSYTIAIDDAATMADRAAAAIDDGHEILKVKLGSDHDRESIEAIREVAPDVTMRVDANEAWDRATTRRMAPFLADHDVELLEQPVPADHLDALRAIGETSPVPLFVDESCRVLQDVPTVAPAVDGIVIKLTKCGSLLEARRMIHTAHAHGLAVMLGCSTESNVSLAGAAQLAPMVSHVDLDGSLLLAEDPFDGPIAEDGSLRLDPETPGTGADRRD